MRVEFPYGTLIGILGTGIGVMMGLVICALGGLPLSGGESSLLPERVAALAVIFGLAGLLGSTGFLIGQVRAVPQK